MLKAKDLYSLIVCQLNCAFQTGSLTPIFVTTWQTGRRFPVSSNSFKLSLSVHGLTYLKQKWRFSGGICPVC